jgi:hypothetical protein
VTARFQTNTLLRPVEKIRMYKNVPTIMMPLFYVEQKFVMDEEKSSELRIGLLMLGGSKYVGFFLIFIGLFIFVLKPLKYYCCRIQRVKKEAIFIKEVIPLVK